MITKLNFMASFNTTGYGVVGRNLLVALHNLGCDVKAYDIANQPTFISKNSQQIYEACTSNNKLFHIDAPCVKIWHQHALDTWAGKGLKVGFPIFELDVFSDFEKYHLNFVDKIMVCSQWGSKIIRDQTQHDNVLVTPFGIDNKIFHPELKIKNPIQPFTFLNVGKWEVRKGHDILPEIFSKAFRQDDKVCLKILASPVWAPEEERLSWLKFYQQSELGSKIEIIQGVESHIDVANTMKAADAGIFPARAEGWNLELLEMMACGKPVIATGYGAHLDFCNDENCNLIYTQNIEPAVDGKWFHGQGNWAEIEDKHINEFADKMRYVYENWQYNETGVETGNKFSWKNSAQILIQNLTNIEYQPNEETTEKVMV